MLRCGWLINFHALALASYHTIDEPPCRELCTIARLVSNEFGDRKVVKPPIFTCKIPFHTGRAISTQKTGRASQGYKLRRIRVPAVYIYAPSAGLATRYSATPQKLNPHQCLLLGQSNCSLSIGSSYRPSDWFHSTNRTLIGRAILDLLCTILGQICG